MTTLPRRRISPGACRPAFCSGFRFASSAGFIQSFIIFRIFRCCKVEPLQPPKGKFGAGNFAKAVFFGVSFPHPPVQHVKRSIPSVFVADVLSADPPLSIDTTQDAEPTVGMSFMHRIFPRRFYPYSQCFHFFFFFGFSDASCQTDLFGTDIISFEIKVSNLTEELQKTREVLRSITTSPMKL